MALFRVTDIQWDTDGTDFDVVGLPESVHINIPDDEDEGAIADALSDEFGFCIKSLSVERVGNGIVILS